MSCLFTDESVFYKCPDRLRLPLVFYFAHTAAVFVNKLMLAGLAKVGSPFLVLRGEKIMTTD